MGLQKVSLGNYEVERNGEKFKFVIENLVSPEEIDEAIRHVVTFFLPREPLCAFTALKDEQDSLNSICTLWRKWISKGTGIGAYILRNDGTKSKLVGVNMTSVSRKDEKDEETFKGKAFNLVLQAVIEQAKASNIYEHYNVEEYFAAMGLSVDSSYHGCNLGYKILESREILCKELGVKVTGTMFTASCSQYLAGKLGYETLVDWDYKSFELNGKYPFYNMWEVRKEKKSKFMALKFQ